MFGRGSDRGVAGGRVMLWELDRRKISEESQTYQQRHTEMTDTHIRSHWGEWRAETL